MSFRSWVYIWSVFIAAATTVIITLPGVEKASSQVVMLILLAVFATVSQYFEATGTENEAYYPHFAFFFAGVVLLHPFLFVLLIAFPHLFEWLIKRLTNNHTLRSWYIQPFNIATHIICGCLAQWVYQYFMGFDKQFPSSFRVAIITLVALVYVLLNHFMIALALFLARGVSIRVSGLMGFKSLMPDIILSYLGYVFALLWGLDPWLIIPALAPLLLMHQALKVPKLMQEANTDVKTGLLNARHFNRMFAAELERARRFNRSMAVIMADLDFMRNINNTYGHLAGDAVLAGIGKIIREAVREYDNAGRFGGEEFAIILPENGPTEARLFAERLRSTIENAEFKAPNLPTPIKATMSLGIACFPGDGNNLTELTQAADVAVYYAKQKGRNCVVYFRDVPDPDHTQPFPTERTVSLGLQNQPKPGPGPSSSVSPGLNR